MSAHHVATIDGHSVGFSAAPTILAAAESLGIAIPTLCHDDSPEARGVCRICCVEVDGREDLLPACHTHLTPGMTVRTRSPRVDAVRRTLLELALAGRNGNGRAGATPTTLDTLAAEYGADPNRFAGAHKPREVLDDDPLIVRDLSRCIRCDRCLRYCESRQSVGALAPLGRGARACIGVTLEMALTDTECRHCGGCISVCLTGALTERWRHELGEGERRGPTLCPYCGTGCQIYAHVADGQILGVTPANGESFNQSDLCVKGRMAFDFVHHPDRLTAPLIKDPAGRSRFPGFREATWEEALDLVADRLRAIRDEHGPSAIMGLSSSRATNEENYMMQKFMRAVIGTNNVDNCARVCHSPSVTGLAAVLGSGAATNSLDEIDDTEVLFLIGCNPTEAHPVVGMRINRARFERGVKLIVADPRQTALGRQADHWLALRPGTNVALLNGVAHVILRQGLHDEAFIAERAENFDEYAASLAEYTPQRVSEITGVPAETIEAAARMYGQADRAMILYGLGVTEHTDGTLGVIGCANLAVLTGHIGRVGCGVNPLRGQNNVQGACDMGALPNVFPGYQPVDDDTVRDKFFRAWGRQLPTDVGLKLTEAWHEARQGRVKAIYIMAENPVQTDPDSKKVAEALQSMEFVVLQEIFMTKTGELADVILPAASFAEKEGTFTNADRRVQRVRRIIPPLDGCKTDLEMLCEISARLGCAMPARTAAQVMDEIASLTPSMAGISHQRLDSQPLVWPCLDANDDGARRLYEDSFPRGKATFRPIEHYEPVEGPDEEYPLILTTGRRLEHYNCGSMSRRTPGLASITNEELLDINPADAERLGIADGQWTEVTSRRSNVRVRARVTDECVPGVVFLSFHFEEVPTNELVGNHLDALACTPEYKVTAVRVSAI